MDKQVKISVRRLVEHVYLSGSIDIGISLPSNFSEGTKIHQAIQKTFSETSQKEVYVQTEIKYDDLLFVIDGRIDGLHHFEETVIVEEIKSTAMDFHELNADTYPVHWAQAFLYGYIYAKDHGLDEMIIQLTYVHKQSKNQKQFQKYKSYSELEAFVTKTIQKYAPFAKLQLENTEKRNISARQLTFPFSSYRKGQRHLAGVVYKGIKEKKTLFIEAPTGIGKTISTTFPAVKAIGEGYADRIIYGTARTTTQEMAENAFNTMCMNGLNMRFVTITAKEKICFKEQTICKPDDCEFANGHYDRVNDAIFDVLQNETQITRTIIEKYAHKHRVCPFEFSIDIAYLADAIICDYNYIFDLQVSFKRFFEEQKKRTVLLIDEAHNLVDRSRDMFSAHLEKSIFLQLTKAFEKQHAINRFAKQINDFFLQLKKQCDAEKNMVLDEVPKQFLDLLEEFIHVAEQTLKTEHHSATKILQDTYFAVQNFLRTVQMVDERFIICFEKYRSEMFIKNFCLDPSQMVAKMMKNFRSIVYFSATLSPIKYYMTMLGADETVKHMTFLSPFSPEQTDVFICPLSTKYRDRERTKDQITNILHDLVTARPGNYFIFFPSYQYMDMVYATFSAYFPKIETIIQTANMSEEDRMEFLNQFKIENQEPFIGFAVMGGIFSEGVDLGGNRLNGVIIVGVGLPQVNFERNLIKAYFNRMGKNGYDYAYVYPGINKVLQAGGRLIRSETDQGTIVLIDDRFLTKKYLQLLPMQWRTFKQI